MSVVAGFLVPGSPLPYVRGDNPPWGELAAAYAAAGAALALSAPDTLLVYSTQWLAVLDQLWLTRPRLQGLHVDENWHEFGDLPFDLTIDTQLTAAIVQATPAIGIRSKGVDYDAFPVDTGTIVAQHFLNPGNTRPLVVASNNLYHDFETTRSLGRIAAEQAAAGGKRVAIIGVGGLSGNFFRETIDPATDHIATAADDRWNQRMLSLMREGAVSELLAACPGYAREARADMGFKHFAFVLGGLAGQFERATVYGYGPLYGTGGAVVEFHV